MSYHIGRKYSVGLGKESSRGTAVTASFWMPKMSLTIDDQINTVVDESSLAVIEDSNSQDVTGKFAQGQLEGRIGGTSFGLILLATLGTETSQAAHSGETIVYDHVFNVNESAQHTSLSVSVAGPNESTGLVHTLAMVDSLDIDLEINKYTTYKMGFRANANASQSNTVSYTAEDIFLPQHGVVKLATSLAGLTAATAITMRKCSLQFKKNIEEDWTIGQLAALDRPNKQFSVEGSFEIVYQDRSYIDTIMIGDLAKALRVSAVNTAVTIGSATNPAIQFDFAKVKLTDVARKLDNNGIVTQTIKFKAFYSLSDAKMVTATLVNLRSTAY